jgi:hypothetical protein
MGWKWKWICQKLLFIYKWSQQFIIMLGVYSLLDWLGTGVLNSTSTAVTAGELCFCCPENRQLCDISTATRLQSSWISDVLSQYILSLTVLHNYCHYKYNHMLPEQNGLERDGCLILVVSICSWQTTKCKWERLNLVYTHICTEKRKILKTIILIVDKTELQMSQI